jgi:small subunit ribosomal protein S6
MFILRPDLTEEQVNQQRRKYYDFLKQNGADKVAIKVWGKRRLAYPIQRFSDGIYILANYTGDGSQVAPIERTMRLSDEVIRYLTIKLKKDLDIEETQLSDVQSSKPEPVPQVQPEPTSPALEVKEEPVAETNETIEVTEETSNPVTVEA